MWPWHEFIPIDQIKPIHLRRPCLDGVLDLPDIIAKMLWIAVYHLAFRVSAPLGKRCKSVQLYFVVMDRLPRFQSVVDTTELLVAWVEFEAVIIFSP